MEGVVENSPEPWYLDDDNNGKHVSGFSTLLVATIQEARDRISQIEYIFCQQLFPDFQSRTKTLRTAYTDARKACEDLWKKKEADLLSLLQQSREEARSLKLENEKMAERLEEEAKYHLSRPRYLEKKVADLEAELEKSARDGEDAARTQHQLLRLFQEKVAESVAGGMRLKEAEDRVTSLLTQVRFLEEKSGRLEGELQKVGPAMSELGEAAESERKALLKRAADSEAEREKERVELLGRIEVGEEELRRAKKRGNDLVVAYKELKSQYNFLCRQKVLHVNNGDGKDENEEVGGAVVPESSGFSGEGVSEEENKGGGSGLTAAPAPVKKTVPVCGMKRMTTHWRETRSSDGDGRPDPHDSFLNTPAEAARHNIGRTEPGPGEMEGRSIGPQKRRVPPLGAAAGGGGGGGGGFKHVETVRKKAEREKLKGVECRQCKKFYDVVGADGEGGVRCEHLDGVSRHRYKYAPPSTPDGFWNIGFDSEI